MWESVRVLLRIWERSRREGQLDGSWLQNLLVRRAVVVGSVFQVGGGAPNDALWSWGIISKKLLSFSWLAVMG